jgi:hypothetical protein
MADVPLTSNNRQDINTFIEEGSTGNEWYQGGAGAA